MSLELILTPNGTCELARNDTVLWSSATDADFQDEFEDEMLDTDDLPDVIDYLVEQDIITEAQAETLECIEETEDEDADDDETRAEVH